MKINDLYEYNKGIQDPNSNAKQSNKNDDEMELEPFTPDQEKEVAKGFKALGAKLGQPIQNPKMAAKSVNNAIQGNKPTPQQLQSKLPIDIQLTKAMQTPALRNQLANILKKANDMDIDESTLAKKILKKLTGKKNLTKFKKRSKLLKEANPALFEINFNKKEIAQQGLDAPVRCGFEAETFFYNVDGRSSSNIDDMSISDVEYEYGDLPDQAYEDFEDWLYEKGQDEYLSDIVSNKVQEVKEDEEWLDDFIDSGDGPGSEAIEIYKKDFEENDPKEYENREEDGWEYMNWVREFVEEEYEDEYLAWLDRAVREEYDFDDDAKEAARDDYSMEDWIYDQYSYMSSFLDDYGYDYGSSTGSLEGVASELNVWIKDNSKFDNYPEYGEYGDTDVTDTWAVETDSSIDGDEGAGAELISPVFSNPRDMLKEMKSLFDWSEDNFGTNNSTGLHITMSWQGETKMLGMEKAGPNKLKMALLLGDEYLLDMFGRLRNSYTKSQYRNVLKYAEEIDAGKLGNFSKLEAALQKGISPDKFSSINFKGQKDSESGNELIEFRIAGGRDYNQMYKEVVQACVRYGTIMKAGYEQDAFRTDYIKAVSRLLRKSKEVDPKTASEFDEISAPIVDSAKELVSKKEYFDVLKSLEISLRNLQQYEELSKPDADKKWKQSVKDFEKGTGSKMDIVEVEQGEPITGYIQPDAIAPSKRAPAVLKKAQDGFIKAVAILAKDISNGTNRSNPNAKSIRVFRDYANQLQLDDNNIQKLLIQQIDDIRPGSSDKENIILLDKGVKALFKKDLIQTPEFLSPQDVDHILKQAWQFAMSDDVNDNTKLDQLVKLLQKVSPHLEYDQIAKNIESSVKARQENEFVRYMKNGSYGEKGILQIGKITTPGGTEELLKFLEPYSGYKHPTSPMHHVNIRSDDRYSQVFQMRLTQRLRDRLEHLKNLETDDPEKANKLKEKLCDIGMDLLEGLKPQPDLWDEEKSGYRRGSDGPKNLATHDSLERWNDAADKLARMKGEIGEEDWTYNFSSAYDDYILSSIHIDRYFSWKESDGPEQDYVLKELHKERFAAIKKFYTEFDKLFQAEGFLNLKAEIQAKNTVDRRNRDFERNVRDNAKAKLNIPSHAYAYIEKEFYDTITDENYSDRAAYLENHLDDFNEHKNSKKVWVIPAAHYGQAYDATEGLGLIRTFEKNDNYYHTWRKTGYNKILSKFVRVHSIPFKDLVYNENKTYIQMGGDEFAKLQKAGIEITRKGDSRAGMPGQDYLIEPEDLENPISGEPIDRGSAFMWNQEDDKEKEMKRFKAFDWSVYPEQIKGLVAIELKGMKNEEGYYSFKVALEKILDRILKGDTGITLNNIDNINGIMRAAGVEDMERDSSNSIASKTNWGNLADYLKIERGVNDQGAELLKKVYSQYDGDHTWKPEPNPDVCCGPRWAAAVKAAYEYIKTNYTVSGGNYFRKNADGSVGDDRTISTPPENEFDSDYDKARANHPIFDTMMQRGIQNYLARGSVNDLVGFLNNPDNDNAFKSRVLITITNRGDMENGPFASFQDALAVTRRQGNESVFDKFDKLPLQEQLRIVNESVVLKKFTERKLSKKEKNKKEEYVKGMKKSKKGFKKRYGDDAEAVMYATATKMAKENKINTNMKNVFEQFEKLSIEKQLEILHSPVVEGFFSDLDIAMRELSYKSFAQKYPEYAHLHPGAEELSTKPVKIKKAPYNKEQHIKNTYNKFKQRHGEAKANIMLQKMIDRGYFNKQKTESLLGIDVLARTKKLTENMPNNNKLHILKSLLSKPFPAGDLELQFKAFLALPIPKMMTAFSQLKSIEGPNACARGILRHYAKNRLPDAEVKQLDLNESYIKEDATEDRLNSIMTALEKNPNFAKRVYKMLKLDKESIDHLDIEDRLKNNDTGKENDHRINKNIMRQLVTSLEQLDHDFDELNSFVETYGHTDYVNTELLNKSGVFKISDMLVGSDTVSKEFIDDLYEKLFDFRINISGSNRGPGELGLCLLSPNVELASVGDIKVNGEEIEVKGEVSSGGGRMVNGIDDFKFSGLAQVKSQLVPFYEKHDIPEELRIYNLKGAVGGGRNQGQAHILDQAQQLEQVKQGVGAEFLKLIVSTYQFVIDSEEEAELTSSFMNMDKTRFLTLVGLMSFKNYAYMLNKKGFNRLIFLNWRYDKVVNCTTEEFPKYSEHLAFTSLDMADSQNGPAVQVSVLK